MLNTRYAPLSQCASFIMTFAALIGMPAFEFTADDSTVHKQALLTSFLSARTSVVGIKLRCKVTNPLYFWMKKYLSTITGKKFGVFYAICKDSRKNFDEAD